ncbi:hypothetical protein [Pedobacter sp. Hv1]|uniref:hypothetical protein n=1 Tax=Pedobacter sp. Hv1 TaxID=1740090 RepID=UPI0006D8D109|nr:hypothetical protein [Pedobacter sp. Hv1]KQC02366.1 hypothetical protein AQF98_01955 [Pedobacter sp. Hv1]
MITKERLMILMFVLFQISCTEQKIEKYNVYSTLKDKILLAKESGQKVKLELCNINSFKWDKIIIIPPYSTAKMLEKYKLDNTRFVENKLLDSLYLEDKCLLLFVEKKTIMKYNFMPRVPLDFNYINDTDTIKILSKKMACEQLYIHNVNNNLKLVY